MDVILIRHAKAGNRDPNSWPDDDDRPLTAEGQAEHRAVMRAAKKMGVKFDFLVTSPLKRARESADIVSNVYRWPEEPQVAEEHRLPFGIPHRVGPGAVDDVDRAREFYGQTLGLVEGFGGEMRPEDIRS